MTKESGEAQAPIVDFDNLIERYSAILFDAYGVLAGSDHVVPEAPAAIDRLNAIGKPYFVLTNDASALPETRAARYAEMGLNIAPERVITSGGLLAAHFAERGLAGARCAVLGTADSAAYVERAGGIVVPSPRADDFDALIIGDQAGFPFLETADAVLSALFRKIDAGRGVHLIMPNPDLIYPEGGGFGFASGSVGLIFESALALRYPDRRDLKFTRLGKPRAAIFEEAERRSGTRDMVMIGDTPDTDIRGANGFGIASALVDTGIAALGASASLPKSDAPTYRLRSLAPGRADITR